MIISRDVTCLVVDLGTQLPHGASLILNVSIVRDVARVPVPGSVNTEDENAEYPRVVICTFGKFGGAVSAVAIAATTIG